MTTQSRIFLTYTLFLLVPLLAVMGVGGYLTVTVLQQGLEREATADAVAVRQAAATAVKVAIVQTLRTIADRNLAMLQSLQQKSQSGALTLDEAQWLALDAMTAQSGEHQGQLFCIDKQGLILDRKSVV